MSDDDAITPQEGETVEKADDDVKTFDAAYVDRLRREAAKYRTEAKANADAAKRLTAIEEAKKTEAQKTAEAIKALETKVTAAQAEALRFKVASQFGIDDDDADLFLTGTDAETLTLQAKRLAERADERKKNGNQVPREGHVTVAVEDENRAYARNLFTGP